MTTRDRTLFWLGVGLLALALLALSPLALFAASPSPPATPRDADGPHACAISPASAVPVPASGVASSSPSVVVAEAGHYLSAGCLIPQAPGFSRALLPLARGSFPPVKHYAARTPPATLPADSNFTKGARRA